MNGFDRAGRSLCMVTGLACAALAACGGDSGSSAPAEETGSLKGGLEATIGPNGGQMVGLAGTSLDGLRLVIPPGALGADTKITITPTPSQSAPALPSTAVRCGDDFAIAPAGLKLAMPATLTLPFDEDAVTASDRFDDEVKVWVLGDSSDWAQQLQTDSSAGSVTVQMQTLTVAAAGVNPPAPTDVVHLTFDVNPKFASCLAQYPNDPNHAPSVQADVVRGELNDGLFLRGKNIKPDLKFDLFTVQNSALLANGTPDPSFTNFGLAWYQSDLEATNGGLMIATIRTILLDQIFGFDPAANLPPTGTFEMGFWFNDPQDAVACGFDATKPTPFNGEHDAGPLAMITTPDATTGLGPLCTHPDTSVSPARCDP
ncbi:MAG TPA: hypothetical protein VHV30_10260 [Polyangiaceae bacterium]|jgi:hypothetical protein|nr:hypothetical protein [Polyangiaceae bacterium]